MNKLKKRWGITSNTQLILILIVFSINGSFAAFIAKPLMEFVGVSKEATSPWLFWTLRILLVAIVYQITLPLVGFCFGQFRFFLNFGKKTLRRISFKK